MTFTGARLQQAARRAAKALPGAGSSRPFTEKLDVYKVAGKVRRPAVGGPRGPDCLP